MTRVCVLLACLWMPLVLRAELPPRANSPLGALESLDFVILSPQTFFFAFRLSFGYHFLTLWDVDQFCLKTDIAHFPLYFSVF